MDILQDYVTNFHKGTLGPAAGSRPKAKRKRKEKEKPKIRNLKRYRIEGDFGTSSRQLAKRKKEKKKPKISAIEWWDGALGPPAGSRPKEKEKQKPKIRYLRRYRIGGHLGTLQPAVGQKEKKKKSQKSEIWGATALHWSNLIRFIRKLQHQVYQVIAAFNHSTIFKKIVNESLANITSERQVW